MNNFPYCEIQSWRNWHIEYFNETETVHALKFVKVGCLATRDDGLTATGSAASAVLDDSLFENIKTATEVRARAELFERVVILESQTKLTADGGALDIERIFPLSSAPDKWQYSKSNGIAAHSDIRLARLSAKLELIERDAVLNSWFGNSQPEPVRYEDERLTRLSSVYEFAMVSFETRANAGAKVYALFAFPKDNTALLAYGFGTAESDAAAAEKAIGECLQRIAFLWGEGVDQLDFSPSPAYHQEYFLHRENEQTLRNWISGAHGSNDDAKEYFESEFSYYDLSGLFDDALLHVVKAWHPHLTPLAFGKDIPFYLAGHISSVHPIC